jgi:hypothetical protein
MSDILIEKSEDIVLPERDICVEEIVAIAGGPTDWRVHLEYVRFGEPRKLASHGFSWVNRVVIGCVDE